MTQTVYKGLAAWTLENDALQLTFLPGYACKMASLISKKTGREFLFQSSDPVLRIPPYGAAFADYDSSGFDEVFPSIDACPYPDGEYKNIPVPDHGEVWAMKWKWELAPGGNKLISSVRSENFPYTLSRLITLKDNEITFHYTVTNLEEGGFKFIWTPHCLLNCSPHTVLVLPDNLTEIITVEHSTRTLGPWGTRHPYPRTQTPQGNPVDMSQTRPASDKSCEKFYFTQKNTQGWCAVKHTDNGDTLTYRYDADKVPYLGVWKTQGGYRGDYNIALEPCTGVYDDLYVAHKIRRAAVCAPKDKYEWNFTMTVGQENL